MVKWKIGKDNMINYLNEGIIPGITVTDGVIEIPDMGAPLVPPSNANITSESVIKYILKALDNYQYIDFRILKIRENVFSDIIYQLERNGYIKILENVISPDFSSVIDFAITDAGRERLRKKRFRLNDINISGNASLGVVSAGISTSLSANR